ncbi:hypothetical protein DVH05_014092 [Phytophthora capsici]|nr:hypothetical protein DVH05_014092 [Phytophthora capsici]
MFNPAFFKPDDIVALRAICENEAENRPGRRLRVGTEDEWRIIGAMAEGTMVCRKIPDFVRSVLDGQERLRLYRTIQVQLEGELVVQLRSWAAVKENRQQPRMLREDILMAATAVGNRVNLNEIQMMLNLAKTLSYNYVQRSIHVYFFDRATAKRFQDTLIPFKGIVYRPTNAHRYDTGSGWTSRRGRDGSRLAEDKEYVIDLFNIARVTDVGRLTAYFRKHLEVGFELEDRDANIPSSPETVYWQLTIKSAECPEFLRGIVRLLWFGRSLVLQHPYAKHRLQCYRCGTLGHTMARM